MRTNTKVLLTTALAAAVAVGVSAPAANARGSRTTTSTATLELVVSSGPDATPNWGEQITFNVSQTATAEPHVDVNRTQGGVNVYGATTGYYASYPWPWTQVMTLSSQSWTGGAADCTAKLYYFDGRKTPVLKTITFAVGA